MEGPSLPATADLYAGLTGPRSFGPGLQTPASSGSGDFFSFSGSGDAIIVPTGYTSKSALSATDTYAGATFANLGLTPGTYTYTLATHDTITFQVGPAAVPEPASLVLCGTAGVGGAGAWLKRRRKAAIA